MKRPIILQGPSADWEAHARAMGMVEQNGNINMGAAMMADPGVTKCEKCNEYLWNEGWYVRCPACGNEFVTAGGKWHYWREIERALYPGEISNKVDEDTVLLTIGKGDGVLVIACFDLRLRVVTIHCTSPPVDPERWRSYAKAYERLNDITNRLGFTDGSSEPNTSRAMTFGMVRHATEGGEYHSIEVRVEDPVDRYMSHRARAMTRNPRTALALALERVSEAIRVSALSSR